MNENEIDFLKKQVKNLTAEVEALRKDKERLDWLQTGHCVLCLCNFDDALKPEQPTFEFEIDGNQGAPRDKELRTAIDDAMAKGEGKA